jgi:dissimilatory sulfite reductase (desulfoviridin) alpha/beta subunit
MQARNAGTLTLLNREGKGKGIFGPTWGYQILRLITSNAKRLQTNITRGFCQFPDAVSLRVDSTTASKFELIIMDAPIFNKVSEMLDEISCQKYSRGDRLYAINICFALNIHRASGAPPPQIVESQQEFF